MRLLCVSTSNRVLCKLVSFVVIICVKQTFKLRDQTSEWSINDWKLRRSPSFFRNKYFNNTEFCMGWNLGSYREASKIVVFQVLFQEVHILPSPRVPQTLCITDLVLVLALLSWVTFFFHKEFPREEIITNNEIATRFWFYQIILQQEIDLEKKSSNSIVHRLNWKEKKYILWAQPAEQNGHFSNKIENVSEYNN